MADGHHPGQVVALSSAGQLAGSVGVGGGGATAATVVAGMVGGDRRPHMNYRRPRVSNPNYHTHSILIEATF
jgi:cation diffusion facilitator CzcD-associated flavoprotein CzcO